MRLIELLADKLPVLIFVIVAVVQIARAVLKSRSAQEQHEQEFDETAEQRQVREIQERLRRTIAERRRQGGDDPEPASPIELPPVIRPEPVAPPAREILRPQTSFDRTEAPVPVANREIEMRNAEMVRQEGLAEQLRRLNEDRELIRRRAAHVAQDAVALSRSETGRHTASRTHLLSDLRRPEDLRRAIMLREVLGPPVALR